MLRHISTFNHFLSLNPAYAEDRLSQFTPHYTQLNPSSIVDILRSTDPKEGDKLLIFILGAIAQLAQSHAISPWMNEKLGLAYQWGVHQNYDVQDQLNECVGSQSLGWRDYPSDTLDTPGHAVMEFGESIFVVARAYHYWQSQTRHLYTAFEKGCQALAEIRTLEAHLAAGRLFYNTEGKCEASEDYKKKLYYPDPYVVPHLNNVERELLVFTKALLSQRGKVTQPAAA